MRIARSKTGRKNLIVPMAVVLGLVALAYTASALQNSSQHKVLFEKAKFTMETKGDLKGAIDLFEEIIKKYPNERDYAAKSLYLIGICYEKLGERQAQQAQEAFQRIVQDYPDQTEEVSLAKEKLLILQNAQAEAEAVEGNVQLRKVLDLGTIGPPSSDGRLFPCWDDSGNLVIMDIWGKEQRLTEDASWEAGDFADSAIISPDGEKVAYGWWHKDSSAYDLKVVNIDGSGRRILYSKSTMSGNEGYLSPLDWTPDGRQILGVLRKKEGAAIGFLTVADGSFHGIKDIGKQNMTRQGPPRLSPDGRWVAYNYLQNAKSDIFIMAADGSREIALVTHPADDFILDWTPGGDSILMASDRSGTWDAWLIPLKNGIAQDDPILVKRDFGRPEMATGISPLGFTTNGSFYYQVRLWMEEVHTATLDLRNIGLLTPPKKVARSFEGTNCYADWSPDGKYLAFASRRGPKSSALCLVSAETGEQRDIFPPGLNRFIRVNWHPDGKSIVVVGSNKEGQHGIFRVDTETEKAIPVVTEGAGFHSLRCTPDGRFLYYEDDALGGDKAYRIMRVDLKTKEKREIYRSTQQIIRMDISPDGRFLAFLEAADSAMKVMPIEGGEPYVLYRFGEGDGWSTSVAWSPDGKNLFFTKIPKDEEGKTGRIELWRIPGKGGTPEKFPLVAQGMENLRIHPDGQTISFNTFSVNRETWAMENFLLRDPSKK